MTNPNYAKYSITDFDKFDCLKMSKWVYACLLFVLRGYVVWLMSVTNMRDHVGVISWIYPQPEIFYLSLLSGLLGIFVVVILSLRRPEAKIWVYQCWARCRTILMLALVFDLIISMVGFFYWQLLSFNWLIGQCIIVLTLIYGLKTSKRFSVNLTEFPEKLPE